MLRATPDPLASAEPRETPEIRAQSATRVHRGCRARPACKDTRELLEIEASPDPKVIRAKLGPGASLAVRDSLGLLGSWVPEDHQAPQASGDTPVQSAKPDHEDRLARWVSRVRRGIPDQKVTPVPGGPTERRVPREQPATLALRARLARRVSRDSRVRAARTETQVSPDPKVSRVPRGRSDHLDPKVIPEIPDCPETPATADRSVLMATPGRPDPLVPSGWLRWLLGC